MPSNNILGSTSSETTEFEYERLSRMCDNLDESVEIEYDGTLSDCINHCTSLGDDCTILNYFHHFKTKNDSPCYICLISYVILKKM